MARRQPITGRRKSTMKPQRARELITAFHTEFKRHALFERQGDLAGATASAARLEALGGLPAYQRASLSGQSSARGGDSSRKLVEWLRSPDILLNRVPKGALLEVGSLHVDNAISQTSFFDRIDRIDLNSSHPLIEQQDFMARQPGAPYAMLSLSLVLNFVPDPKSRGSMLRHARKFLSKGGLMFFVLPAPCLTNSRYTTKDHMQKILAAAGFLELKYLKTDRLVYWLLTLGPEDPKPVGKTLLSPGAGRNNFAIELPALQGFSR